VQANIKGMEEYAREYNSKVASIRAKRRKEGGILYNQDEDEKNNPIRVDYFSIPCEGLKVIDDYKLKDWQVFRYEYRLKKTQTVMSEINTALGREYKTPILFKDLFTPDLFKTMVLKSWRDIIQRPENQLALIDPEDTLALLLHILSEARMSGTTAHSLNKALISYGLARGIKDHGAKQIRELVLSVWSNEHPERFTKKIEMAGSLTRGIPYSNGIAFVDRAIEEFKPITLDYLRTMV